MDEENHSNKQIMELSGADPTAATRWKRQYIAEQRGEEIPTPPLNADKRRIKELEAKLAESQEALHLLKRDCISFV